MVANTKDAKSLMNKTMPLSQAMKDAPNVSGCYQIYYKEHRIYVGKAQDGIRKRFVQYYNGTTAHYSSAIKIFENREDVYVKWKVIEDADEVIKQEAKWIEKYKPEWNKQSGWGDKGVLVSNSSVRTKNNKNSSGGQYPASGKELASQLAKNVGKSVATSAGITAAIEIGKGITKEETVGQCTEHTVNKAMESGASGAGAEIGAFLFSSLGPVGKIGGGIATGILTSELIDGVFDDVGFRAGVVADELVEKATDALFDASMTIGSIGEAIVDNPVTDCAVAVCENIADGIGSLFDGLFSWF